MNFLIIGSKGFIGTHLVNFLKKESHEVYEADVIVDYEKNDNYFVIDASNADYHSIFENNNIDVCVNGSGAASVPDSIKQPHRDFQLNTVNVFKILDAIRHYQPDCKFINLSSAAVYGNPKSLPIHEKDDTKPISPYGYHKWMSEQICEEYYRFFNIKTCSLRIFSAYGEGLKKQLFWDLGQRALRSNEVRLFGTGGESRDFIYITDLVRAILIIAEKAAFKGEAINVANGIEITIAHVAKTFYQFFDQSVDLGFTGESRPGDPNNWQADITQLSALGYKPQYSIEEGLQNYVEWLKKRD